MSQRSNLGQLCDDYGTVCAQIKRLEERKEDMRKQFTAMGVGSWKGDSYMVTVSRQSRNVLDTGAIRAALTASVIKQYERAQVVIQVSASPLV